MFERDRGLSWGRAGRQRGHRPVFELGNGLALGVGELRAELHAGAAGAKGHVQLDEEIRATDVVLRWNPARQAQVIPPRHPYRDRLFALADDLEVIRLVPVPAVLTVREGREDAAHDDEVVVIEDVLAHEVRGTDRVLVQELLVGGLVHDAQDAATVFRQERDAQVAVLQHHGVVRRAGDLRAGGRGAVPDAVAVGLDGEVRELERGGRARDGVGDRGATGSAGARAAGASPTTGSNAARAFSSRAAAAARRGFAARGSRSPGRVASPGITSGAATGGALLGPTRPATAARRRSPATAAGSATARPAAARARAAALGRRTGNARQKRQDA